MTPKIGRAASDGYRWSKTPHGAIGRRRPPSPRPPPAGGTERETPNLQRVECVSLFAVGQFVPPTVAAFEDDDDTVAAAGHAPSTPPRHMLTSLTHPLRASLPSHAPPPYPAHCDIHISRGGARGRAR